MPIDTVQQGNSKQKADKHLSVVLLMVCIYMFLTIERPWESFNFLYGVPIERVFAIGMIVLALLAGKFRVVNSPTNKWVYGLLVLHFVLAPFAFNPEYSVEQGLEYSKMVVLYMLILAVGEDEETLKILIKAYVFSMLFYMLHSLFEYYNGRHVWRMGISRMIGVDETNNSPNGFGASVVLSLPFVYALLRTEVIPRMRKLYFSYFLLATLCVVLTGSRSAFIGLIFLMILWVAVQKGGRKYLMLFVAVLSVGILWVVMPDEKQERIRTLWDENAGPKNAHESAMGRLVGLKVSWEMFKREPFNGVGAGGKNFIGYRMVNNIDVPGQESPTQSHILYGEVLAEFGVLGVIFFAGLVLSIWKCASSVRGSVANELTVPAFLHFLSGAIISSLLLLLLLGLAGHNFYRPLWLWLAAWSGNIYLCSRKIRTRER